MNIVKFAFLGVLLLAGTPPSAHAQDPKAQEIFSKSLEAVGLNENREALKTMMAIGVSEFESNAPVVRGGGKALVVSDPLNLFFAISLNSKEYPFEKIGYFNGQIKLPFIDQGTRSPLGSFLANNQSVLREGLFGGVMSLRWPIFNADRMKVKTESRGTKNIGERKFYVVEYGEKSSGSGQLQVKLYFDAETFRHARTEYFYQSFPPDATSMGTRNGRSMSQIVITEDFDDFKPVDGLTLPFRHRITLSANGGGGAYQNIWTVRVGRYVFNQSLAPDFFTFEPKPSN